MGTDERIQNSKLNVSLNPTVRVIEHVTFSMHNEYSRSYNWMIYSRVWYTATTKPKTSPVSQSAGFTIRFVSTQLSLLSPLNWNFQALNLAQTTAKKSYFVDDNFGNVRGAKWAHCAFLYDAALDAQALAGTGAGGGVGNIGELKPEDGIVIIHNLEDLRRVWPEVFMG
jgi:hypothetical protein